MTFHSVLFEKTEESIKKETPEAPVFFVDLNLDQIIDAVAAGKQEYNLKPFFYTSLKDIDAIKYRHEIFQDLEDKNLFGNIKSFAQKMRAMREHLAQADKLHYKYQKQSWFLEAVKIYCDAVNCLVHHLSPTGLKSRGLLAFREYLTEYANSERFRSLVRETKKVFEDFSSVRYLLHLRDGSIDVRKYEYEMDYAADVEKTFEKFKQGAVKDYGVKFFNDPEMNHVEAAVLDLVARLYSDIFLNFDNYCTENRNYLDEAIAVFDREIQFYISYLDFLAVFQQAGLKFCYPQISNQSKEIYDQEGFDLALANKLIAGKSPVVCNDFYLEDKERVLVVSGPNQGGKTTFARTFGQLHYLGGDRVSGPGEGGGTLSL